MFVCNSQFGLERQNKVDTKAAVQVGKGVASTTKVGEKQRHEERKTKA
jgi:hypothetical protein